jgi:hypothetical protein
MDEYKKMYYTLFNKLTDIIYELQMLQRQTEEMCPNRDMEPQDIQGSGGEQGEG